MKLEPREKEQQMGEILVYQADNGKIKLDVRLQDETVWLTQQLIAELFQTTIPNISMHVRNIYEEDELTPEATIKKFLTVRQEGTREVRRREFKESLGEAETIKQLEKAAKMIGDSKPKDRKRRK